MILSSHGLNLLRIAVEALCLFICLLSTPLYLGSFSLYSRILLFQAGQAPQTRQPVENTDSQNQQNHHHGENCIYLIFCIFFHSSNYIKNQIKKH